MCHVVVAADMMLLRCRVYDDVLADTFEALVGALYLDSGMQAASDFVLRVAEVITMAATPAMIPSVTCLFMTSCILGTSH